MLRLLNRLQDLLDATRALDFLAPLAIRAYLIPIFWMAGNNKLADMPSTIEWFGNPDWGLGLPLPELMAWAAALTEAGGAVLLTLGLATRWISIPLMTTMVVAAVTVHWPNGWSLFAESAEAKQKIEIANTILQEHAKNWEWLSSSGDFVILNNGMELAATYFIMLLVLFFIGGGRYFSLDYWIARRFRKP
jgi:uncharacterized membrane protein YphA (DoxX/SURF4 family)